MLLRFDLLTTIVQPLYDLSEIADQAAPVLESAAAKTLDSFSSASILSLFNSYGSILLSFYCEVHLSKQHTEIITANQIQNSFLCIGPNPS